MVTQTLPSLNWIARLGQNPQFVAAFAHSGVAFALVEHLPGRPLWWALAMTGYALLKEFYYDLRYEKNPPQTLIDSLQDFAGYELGAWLAVLVVHFKL